MAATGGRQLPAEDIPMLTLHSRILARRLVASAALLACAAAPLSGAWAASSTSFKLVRTAGLPGTCAANAKATAKIVSLGFAEKLTVSVTGLAPNTATD